MFFGPGRHKLAVMVGAIKPAKDYPLALDTAAALVKSSPEWRVLFLGDQLTKRVDYGVGKDSDSGDYKAAEAREQNLTQVYSRQSGLVSSLADKITHDHTLKHEVDSNRQFYESMVQKVNEAGIASAVRQSNIRLVGPAKPSPQPYKPRSTGTARPSSTSPAHSKNATKNSPPPAKPTGA